MGVPAGTRTEGRAQGAPLWLCAGNSLCPQAGEMAVQQCTELREHLGLCWELTACDCAHQGSQKTEGDS